MREGNSFIKERQENMSRREFTDRWHSLNKSVLIMSFICVYSEALTSDLGGNGPPKVSRVLNSKQLTWVANLQPRSVP